MEFRTRCRLIPAVFALTLYAVPALAQDAPDLPPSAGNPASPGGDQDPTAPRPGAPGGQPFFAPGNPRQDRTPFPMGQPFFTPSPDMNFNPMLQQSPELAKKMRSIMALRAMWQLRLNAKDIAAILPPLKELAQAEKNLQVRSEQLLEDERKALLAADPEGDPPDGPGDLMQRENDLYRIKADDTWRAIDRSLGKNKTNGLRGLVGMGGPQMLRPLQDDPRDRGAFSPDVPPGPGGQPRPRSFNGDQARPTQNRQPNPQGRDNIPATAAPRGGQFGGAPQGDPFGGGRPPQDRFFNNGIAPQMMPQVRLTLAELVTLLSDKQAAMRR